jgi:hypothetical protein
MLLLTSLCTLLQLNYCNDTVAMKMMQVQNKEVSDAEYNTYKVLNDITNPETDVIRHYC